AHAYPNEEHPELAVRSVKVYRLVHRILPASEFAQGIDPLDPTQYLPYFEGEFDPDGNLMTPPDDPFLYWLIPIIRLEKAEVEPARPDHARPDPHRGRRAGALRPPRLQLRPVRAVRQGRLGGPGDRQRDPPRAADHGAVERLGAGPADPARGPRGEPLFRPLE